MNWISFDWDYITGDRLDGDGSCARRCGRMCNGSLGRGRSASNILWRHGREALGLLRMHHLLKRVTVTRAVFRDSHASIGRFLHRGDVVYHFDDHEDSGDALYEEQRLWCGNWVTHVERRGVVVRQFNGREREVPDGEYALFVCWSRPYTGRDADGALLRFLGRLKCGVDFQAAKA